ncbi:MAG TPA: hemolysin III family protein [Anaerovoracaceae bacterium]|nr:hemolysin III family protein [Anaerovoracaceae bacterium]
MTNVLNFNDQCKEEEIVNAVSHGFGAALAIAGTVVMLVYASHNGATMGIVSASIYGFSLISLYIMSTLYHSFRNINIKKTFQKFDHCSIFVLIVGSYAPICLSLLGGTLGWTLFAVNVFLAIAGIIANMIDIKKWHKLSLLLYLLMGWSIIFAIKPLMNLITFDGFMLLLIGGLCYTIGVIFYKAKKPHYMHSVWHLFVLCGSTFHYFFILFYIIL